MTKQNVSSHAASFQDEANIRQRDATRPDAPVWVGASAGSGKTRVLVNRLLRLMLPSTGRMAAKPGQILCITFTRAGASEVMERVIKILREWTIAPGAELQKQLGSLLEETPDTAQINKARALFAEVIETPGGMKIMTIHAFCQSVLARFPMEAGLPAGFEVMVESEARALMRDVRRAIITRLRANTPADKALKAAFDYLSTARSAADIESLMERMMAERGRLRSLLARHSDVAGLCAAVERALDVPANADAHAHIHAFCMNAPEGALRSLLPRMAACTTKKNKEYAKNIADFFAIADRTALFDDYKRVFLTNEGAPRKLVGIIKDDDAAQNLFATEVERLLLLDTALRNIATAQGTNALLRFTAETLAAYEAEKRARNRLDFEDLIDRTRRLLDGSGVNWVQYKLDGGIDHILVDEAQDTNPDQWDIITALYDEFYAGIGRRDDRARTTFVVGDEKQSIFSFQRADPRVFARMHARLEEKAEGAENPLKTIPMRVSFRSAPSILAMVDAVFDTPAMRQGVVQDVTSPIEHLARNTGKAGRVELWPLIKKPEAAEREAWALPLRAERTENPVAQMADRLARKIRALLDNPAEMLESKARCIRPGDIMVLLGKRAPLAEAVLKALRAHNIPVSGIDRMVLTKQLAVRDCLAATAFILQPDDDLNLAALLKSPFIGLDEEALFTLAAGRGRQSLWQSVKDSGGENAAWLSSLLALEGNVAAVLHAVLYRPCPADNHSGMRALLARLGADMRDPLQELLARADAHDLREEGGLQSFLQNALNDESQVKRDLQEGGDHVRVMTVHGSKGLEAPIVFLPDTIRTTAARTLKDQILWPERGDENGVPLWAATSAQAADIYKARLDAARTRGDEEQRRLLYVALTRAADRLYIGGVQKSDDSRTDRTNSWYFACEDAMKRIGVEEGDNWVLANRQTDAPQTEAEKPVKTNETAPLPAWLFTPAPAPESPPRPLMPSRPEADDPAVMSPLFGDISRRFQRGRLIHTLFQFLPDLPADERLVRAAQWLSAPAHNLTVPAQNEILEATFNVLDNPAFAHIFTADARAEVPVTGHLAKADGTHAIVSGQIDRLLVSDSEIVILDYKTNRPAPKKPGDVPEAYRRQMRTYRDILAGIWPGKPVRCALLWTDGPDLMDITPLLQP